MSKNEKKYHEKKNVSLIGDIKFHLYNDSIAENEKINESNYEKDYDNMKCMFPYNVVSVINQYNKNNNIISVNYETHNGPNNMKIYGGILSLALMTYNSYDNILKNLLKSLVVNNIEYYKCNEYYFKCKTMYINFEIEIMKLGDKSEFKYIRTRHLNGNREYYEFKIKKILEGLKL